MIFSTITAITNLLLELITLGWKVRELYKEAQEKKWIENGRSLRDQLNDAKTDEERANLAKLLFKHRAQ